MEILPQVTSLAPTGLLEGRRSRAVFVRKHNLEANLVTVKSETSNIRDSNTHDFLFLVEGHRRYHSIENRYLDECADGLDIQVEDPIKNPFKLDIAQAASVEKMIAALSVLVMDYLDAIAQSQQEVQHDDILEVLFRQSLHEVAEAFEVSPKSLEREFQRLRWRNEELLTRQLLILSEKRKQLIGESNKQSRRELVEVLERNDHPNLFIMSGIEHSPVFIQPDGSLLEDRPGDHQ